MIFLRLFFKRIRIFDIFPFDCNSYEEIYVVEAAGGTALINYRVKFHYSLV